MSLSLRNGEDIKLKVPVVYMQKPGFLYLTNYRVLFHDPIQDKRMGFLVQSVKKQEQSKGVKCLLKLTVMLNKTLRVLLFQVCKRNFFPLPSYIHTT